jgi:5-methylcytosine-specific restriction endonuclease McrA
MRMRPTTRAVYQRYAASAKGKAQARKTSAAHRARKLDQFIEDVDPDVVYQMYGGMCGICKDFVAEDDFHVDHVIPLAKGGMHGYINVQPAHPLCNFQKGAFV